MNHCWRMSESQEAISSSLAVASADLPLIGAVLNSGIEALSRTSLGRQPNSALKTRLKWLREENPSRRESLAMLPCARSQWASVIKACELLPIRWTGSAVI